VLYQGINNVQLLPGFSVAPTGGTATVFRAEIGGGCEDEVLHPNRRFSQVWMKNLLNESDEIKVAA
jgi:hypothetical protein